MNDVTEKNKKANVRFNDLKPGDLFRAKLGNLYRVVIEGYPGDSPMKGSEL